MTVYLVTYATPAFEPYQALSTLTARKAGFDQVQALGPGDLDPRFVEAHRDTLVSSRGAGYWLWKPYVVARVLDELDDGDLLWYADAALHFVSSIEPVHELMDARGLDVLLFGEGFRESMYTKRDAFVLMDCNAPRYWASPQRFASAFVLRRSSLSRELAARFLAFAEDPRILTDRPSEHGPDAPDFVAHRHDQSILSLLTKRFDIEVPPNRFLAEWPGSGPGTVLCHTRTHVPPGQVLARLLATGVLRASDLEEIRLEL